MGPARWFVLALLLSSSAPRAQAQVRRELLVVPGQDGSGLYFQPVAPLRGPRRLEVRGTRELPGGDRLVEVWLRQSQGELQPFHATVWRDAVVALPGGTPVLEVRPGTTILARGARTLRLADPRAGELLRQLQGLPRGALLLVDGVEAGGVVQRLQQVQVLPEGIDGPRYALHLGPEMLYGYDPLTGQPAPQVSQPWDPRGLGYGRPAWETTPAWQTATPFAQPASYLSPGGLPQVEEFDPLGSFLRGFARGFGGAAAAQTTPWASGWATTPGGFSGGIDRLGVGRQDAYGRYVDASAQPGYYPYR